MQKKSRKRSHISFFILLAFLLLVLLAGCTSTGNVTLDDSYDVGFIGAITGPVAKYGSHEAVVLAVEEINANGGINGKRINLIAEDGKCNSKEAINAVNKLISADGVKVILGGHCSPESVAIAPIVEQSQVVMLASITTSPHLSDKGDYVFRTSPVNTNQVPLLVKDMQSKGYGRIAIVYEQTDYAAPIAEKLKELHPGTVTTYEAYAPDATDFRTVIAKIVKQKPDAIFMSPQSPNSLFLFVKQLHEHGVEIPLYGNDIFANSAAFVDDPSLREGIIFPSPAYDVTNPKTEKFIAAYTAKYVVEPPMGFWTADAYDAVYVLAEAIELYGVDPDAIKEHLYTVDAFEGASGSLAIDSLGDGIRPYGLQVVQDGELIGLGE